MLRLASFLSLLLLVRRISAFTVVARSNHHRGIAASSGCATRRPFLIRAVSVDNDVYTELERELGIKDGKLALGIDPNDVVKYIGRREDLVEKTMQDIPSFSRAQAEEEVDKFLMDQEAVQMFINFGKAKEDDPDFVVPEVKNEEEGPFSFKNIVIGYLGYVVLTSVGPKFFRKWVGQQQEAGTWTGTGIQAVDDWIANTPVPAPPSKAVIDVVSSSASSSAASDAVSAASAKIAPVVAESAASATESAASALQAAAADMASSVAEAATQVSSSDAGQSLFDVASGVFQ